MARRPNPYYAEVLVRESSGITKFTVQRKRDRAETGIQVLGLDHRAVERRAKQLARVLNGGKL